MSVVIEPQVLSPADYDLWEKFVATAPGGSIYALPSYLEVLCAVTSADYRVVALRRGGEILGGLALYERSHPAGRFVAPRLLLYYNGPVFAAGQSKYPSERTSLQIKLVAALEAWLLRQGYGFVRLHSRDDQSDVRPWLSRGWTTSPSYSYEVSFSDLDAAWDRVEGNFRRLIRRCEREGFRLVSDDDFDTFYRLHREIHDRKSVPLYLPQDAFRRYYEGLRERGLCRIFHARAADGHTPASQLVLLGPHPVTHTVCAGSSAQDLNSGASVFLRWQTSVALHEMGYQANDLTDAALNPVTRFKSQLGGDLKLSHVLTGQSSLAWRLQAKSKATLDFADRAVRYAAKRLLRRHR